MNFATKKILIIDGHPVYISKLEGFLRGLTYDQITLARTGREGLDQFPLVNPDLVILSGMLPDMEALEVCRTLREQSKTRIIVQKGLFTQDEDVERFKQSGADIVLDRREKDLNPLEQAIAAVLADG